MNHLPHIHVSNSRENVANSEPLLSWSDEELLTGFRQGQREAFGLLVRRYERELYGYLRRYLGDDTLADDVFQNTFLQVFVKIDQYEAGRPVRPWLYTIATNQAVDALRRNGRRPAASLDQMVRETSEGEVRSLLDLLESNSPDPLLLLQDEERRLKVRASVDQLPDFLRQVVILAYYQGLKYRDVAEILDIPVGTVKSRLHAALGKLHEIWSAASGRTEPRRLKAARK
jgi:RNA polymerase sigma-70 factor (ECF subfamily)